MTGEEGKRGGRGHGSQKGQSDKRQPGVSPVRCVWDQKVLQGGGRTPGVQVLGLEVDEDHVGKVKWGSVV